MLPLRQNGHSGCDGGGRLAERDGFLGALPILQYCTYICTRLGAVPSSRLGFAITSAEKALGSRRPLLKPQRPSPRVEPRRNELRREEREYRTESGRAAMPENDAVLAAQTVANLFQSFPYLAWRFTARADSANRSHLSNDYSAVRREPHSV